MQKLSTIIIATIVATACSHSITPLEYALKQSGDNRHEWEKVLAHYSQSPADSLKYKAAVFLISNMPGHYWYESKELATYRDWVDSTYSDMLPAYKRLLYVTPEDNPAILKTLHKKEDLLHLKADFLINRIEYCFRLREEMAWMQNFSFNDFCEYILPYRLGNENPYHLTPETDSLIDKVQEICKNYDDIKYNPASISQTYNFPFDYWLSVNITSLEFGGKTLPFKPTECRNEARFGMYSHRMYGVPAVIDFTPAFPHRNDRHYWHSIITPYSPNGHSTEYTNEKIGKIYRKVFSIQPHPDSSYGEYIPPFFRNPFHKDVTKEYSPVSSVNVQLHPNIKNKYVYLCVFNDLKWIPVAYAERTEDYACFNALGRDVVYLPVVYDNRIQQPAGYPFILSIQGNVHYLNPSKQENQTLCLQRKYPADHRFYPVFKTLEGCTIEASHDSLFTHPITIGTFHTDGKMVLTDVQSNTSEAFRYWRFKTNNKASIIAEILSFDHTGKKVIPSRLISSGNLYENPEVYFDNDALTYAPLMQWVGWDFGKPVNLSRIRCIARNDDNGVWNGNYYELFYQDQDGWVSLGRRLATTDTLLYHNVPCNALLWLKNHTKGKEERIFTADKAIRFW